MIIKCMSRKIVYLFRLPTNRHDMLGVLKASLQNKQLLGEGLRARAVDPELLSHICVLSRDRKSKRLENLAPCTPPAITHVDHKT